MVETHRTAHFKVSDNQQVKTTLSPCVILNIVIMFQHPTLTTGQKLSLSTIANVYSTDHVRRLMKQHYLYLMFKMDNERNSGSRIKPYGQRKGTTVHSKVILSKIAKSQ
uniref:Uncharacterized protein n=1 Tax=Oncorhynchus tshawytscha TaxID=74940 RepID=A0A8C8D737_ONCTS